MPYPPAPEPELPWTAALDAPPLGPPLVIGDALLLPAQVGADNRHSALHAFNLTNEAPLWPEPLKFDHALISGLAAPPRDTGLLVLVATAGAHLIHGSGALLALDASGQVHWRWPAGPDMRRVSAPALAGDQVCVTADAHTLTLIDLADGVERARIHLEVGASQCAPAVMEDVAYVPCRGPHLLAVELPGGATRWRFDLETDAPTITWLDPTPLLVGQQLFTATSTGAVLALDAQEGKPLWQVQVGPAGKRLGPLATDEARLFVGARDGLHALDLADGHTRWTLPRRVTAAPVALGGVVYVACHDHHLYALDAISGHVCWRHEVERRIEHAPAVIPYRLGTQPWAVVVDRGGTLTTLRRPLSAVEYEAAGEPVAAAAAYADRGRPAQGAQLLERHGKAFKAAELWKAAGELERAAVDYETAGVWQAAAELWRALERSFKYATALETYARTLPSEADDETRATAWETAGQALMAEGERERAADCQRAVARWRRQPLIALEVQHEGLLLKAWSTIQFIVRNQGFGPAQKLIIHATSEQFKGDVIKTRQITKLRAGKERRDQLGVCPRQYGPSVPLRVQIEYQDRQGQDYTFEQTLRLPVACAPVARGAVQTNVIYTGGGMAIVGDVDTGGGDMAGRDQHAAQARAEKGTPGIAPSSQSIQLRRLLTERLNLEELRVLCFDLGVRYDHLSGDNVPVKVVELLSCLQRRKELPRLIEWLRHERPDIPL